VTVLPDVIRAPARLPLVAGLRDHGDRIAVITRDGRLTYGELADRVDDVAHRLGSHRRLVLVPGANNIDALVTYLGGLCGGHVVLLAAGDNAPAIDGLIAAYDPDVVARSDGDEWLLDERRELSAHELHPDLALLLSTSGSTGSPKLVRLSYENLQANAAAIVDYLGIRPSDRAVTSLPMHYCYGLSVVHSHLLAGATLILTDLSVVDACFWDLFREAGGTTFAGVPHTFDLLDRVGFATMRLPGLRYVTQAGGRLAPEIVRRYAELGRSQGWDFYVMYGQTEATARMAYLPPDLAAARPEAIGVPIPGGAFTLEPVPDGAGPDVGELVYTGPNVMLGYAESPADLALGRTVDALRTGDLARRAEDGLYELVGRRSRFAKVFGLRIDLQRVEALLAVEGLTACCVGADDALVVGVEGGAEPGRVRELVARGSGLPDHAVRVRVVDRLPRLATGKPDLCAVERLAWTADEPAPAPPGVTASALRTLFAQVLGRSDVTDDSTFVSLGGDSLSYVELSLRLEQALGRLPAGWHTTPIGELVPTAPAKARRGRAVETSVALRALAIVLIVGSHVELFEIQGGAHLLLGVAGFNFARFHLTAAAHRDRLRHLFTSVGRIAVAGMSWIALASVLAPGDYTLANFFLLNGFLGPDELGSEWRYWFVEARCSRSRWWTGWSGGTRSRCRWASWRVAW
jgi:acyl-CoA synthetase (AMP-forming)/AMP-acid ligase II